MDILTWIGIVFCLSQSAIFSGLNLAFFSISKLRLEIEVANGNKAAIKVNRLRQDSNFLLATILWGNVGINVLLTLLSNSVMVGVSAFIFSTIAITIFGEIMPQAYFSRHALRIASLLSPVLRFYQILIFPVAKGTSVLLDRWLGPESISYFKEKDFRELVQMHVVSDDSDIHLVEGKGVLNFLALDDLPINAEGEILAPGSEIVLPFVEGRPVFPDIKENLKDPFLKQIQVSGKKWVILTDQAGEPHLALDVDGYLRVILFTGTSEDTGLFCHRPIIVRDPNTTLGEIIPRLQVHARRKGDDVIDEDIILCWCEQKRIITGSDILGRLLQGIVRKRDHPSRIK
ncbi:DUF21 domain-containing protein [Candidatus Zixiibacteriota bacterium]